MCSLRAFADEKSVLAAMPALSREMAASTQVELVFAIASNNVDSEVDVMKGKGVAYLLASESQFVVLEAAFKPLKVQVNVVCRLSYNRKDGYRIIHNEPMKAVGGAQGIIQRLEDFVAGANLQRNGDAKPVTLPGEPFDGSGTLPPGADPHNAR